jgi:hypothetical protein
MGYRLLATKNNSESPLSASLGASTTSILVNDGDKFPVGYSAAATSLGSGVLLNLTGVAAALSALSITAPFFIRNVTDGSSCFCTSIGTNALTTTTLKGGSDNLWQSADVCAVGSFVLTLNSRDASDNITDYENALIQYADNAGNILHVETGGRGYNGTSADSWSADDYASLFPNDSTMDGYLDALEQLFEDMEDKPDSTDVVLNTLFTTEGDIVYASATDTPARLGIGSEGQALKVIGGVPAWGALTAQTSFSDTEFDIYDDTNYIGTAPSAPTIAEGGAGSVSATSVIVRLGYASTTGYTEAGTSSNTLASVINQNIDIPVVESADAGCTGIVIELNIDGAGFEYWSTVANTTTTIVYDDEALTTAILSASNTSKASMSFDADSLTADREITLQDQAGTMALLSDLSDAVSDYNFTGTASGSGINGDPPDTGTITHGLGRSPNIRLIAVTDNFTTNRDLFLYYTGALTVGHQPSGGSDQTIATATISVDATEVSYSVAFSGSGSSQTASWGFRVLLM